ncbi:MAG: cytochrome c3 family protein, partial [bacterium]
MTGRGAPAAALALVLTAGTAAAASITNSPHDMASGSTHVPASPQPAGAVPPTGTNETCVFCHTTHRALRNVPLWNHTESSASYTFYSSYYLNTYLGFAPLSGTAMLAGTRTKMCLSCHDGVTAVGSVFNLAGSAGATITMTMALGASAFLGTNLADDHPVFYPVDTTKDLEIKLPPAGDPVKLYDPVTKKPQAVPANGGLVECTSCHDAHDNGQNTYGKFLVENNDNGAICTTCHVKTGFAGSIHQTSPTLFTPPPSRTAYPAKAVGVWACFNCHRMHAAGGTGAYLNRGAAAGAGANPEENTCFVCHGNPPLTAGTKNIQSELALAVKHPTVLTSGIHRNPELSGTCFSATPDLRHAECTDCHDPHGVKARNRFAMLPSRVPANQPTNLSSEVLLYAWGVVATYSGGAWTTPTMVRTTFLDTTSPA